MTPDDLAARYQELRETRGTIPSLEPFGIRGEICTRCKKGRPTKLTRVRDRGEFDQRDEKIVCDTCFADKALVVGDIEAARLTEPWSGQPQRAERVDSASNPLKVSSSKHRRSGATEARMAAAQDAWDRVAPYFETIPPGSNPARWRFGVEAMLLLQHNDLGSHALVAELGPFYYPGLGPWNEDDVERAIRYVRLVVARRRRDRSWRQAEMAIDPNDAISTSEAAGILRCSGQHVRDMIDAKQLEAVDWRRPGMHRPEWRVSRKAVNAELRKRSEAGGSGSVQSAFPVERLAIQPI
jgi:hypothetical protein